MAKVTIKSKCVNRNGRGRWDIRVKVGRLELMPMVELGARKPRLYNGFSTAERAVRRLAAGLGGVPWSITTKRG